MSSIQAGKERLRRLKEQRQKRKQQQQQAGSTIQAPQKHDISKDRRPLSIQRSEGIQLPRETKEYYDIDIQCALQTRSLDSKHPREDEDEGQGIDLLQPKQHKRKRQDGHHQFKLKQVQQLNQEQLQNLVKSKHFNDFFNKSSKFMEKVLDHGDGDMLELYLSDGIKTKSWQGQDALAHTVSFHDKNYTMNRVVTDIDWSHQIPELFLTSYSQNDEGSIKDHVGVILLWSLSLKSRPEFYCFCQSQVTSAKFFPFSNSTVIGGCYNGQLLLWDVRVKSMPIQRTGISGEGHKYPVNAINVVGTQIANSIYSFSNDGTMCQWDIKQFSRPLKSTKQTALRSVRQTQKNLGNRLMNSRVPQLGSGSVLDKGRDEPHDVNITCCQFPSGDANNYYIGSLNGVMYKNALHNKSTDKIVMHDQHNGPISALSVNNPSSENQALSGLVLTSSFDWTVKLWSPNSNQSIRTFQHSQDYIYDVSWNPGNPSLFSCVNNEGYLDLFDLTKDVELPIVHKRVNNSAQNKCEWNKDGSLIVTGDSSGNVNLFTLADKNRKLDHSKLDDFQNVITQAKQES